MRLLLWGLCFFIWMRIYFGEGLLLVVWGLRAILLHFTKIFRFFHLFAFGSLLLLLFIVFMSGTLIFTSCGLGKFILLLGWLGLRLKWTCFNYLFGKKSPINCLIVWSLPLEEIIILIRAFGGIDSDVVPTTLVLGHCFSNIFPISTCRGSSHHFDHWRLLAGRIRTHSF